MSRIAAAVLAAAAVLTLAANSRSAIQSPQGRTYAFGVLIDEIAKSNGQQTPNEFGTSGLMTFGPASVFTYSEGGFVAIAPGTWSENAKHVAKAEVNHTAIEHALTIAHGGGSWHVKKFSYSAIKSDAVAITGKNTAKYKVDDSGTITSFTDNGQFGGFSQ